MNDRGDELIRQAAELKAESEQLVAVSEGLAGRLPKSRKAGARERRPAPAAAAGTRGAFPAGTGPQRAPALPAPGASRGPGLPGGDRTGEVSVTRPGPWPGAGILDQEEAVTLAVLLEDLAARPGPDRLSGPALQAAALLRRRVTAGQRRGIRPRWGGPEARREAGDTRDGAAGHRDAQALQRDRRAGERDDRATERDRQADAADEKARASDQRMLDRLRAADLREKAAAGQPPASDDAGRRHWPPDRDGAGAAPGCRDDREAIRELLAAALGARRAARHDRYAGGQDRVAARRDRDAAQADRQAAARDRQTARANRDQAVIESEEEDPRPGTDLA